MCLKTGQASCMGTCQRGGARDGDEDDTHGG